jgi:hypothetical protein
MLFTKKRVFAAATETTPGTAISLSSTHGVFNAFDFKIEPNITKTKREGQGGFGKLASASGAYAATATFKTELAYDGTNLPSWATVLLPACGIVATSNVFAPKTEDVGTNVKTVTLGSYVGGKLKSMYGAMGNAKFLFVTGEIIMIDWTFEGIWADETTTAMITPNYPNADKGLRCGGGAWTWDSVNLCARTATLDLGNTVVPRYCAATDSGIENMVVSDRTPILSIDPESKLVSEQNRYLKFREDTEAALSATIGGPGNSTVVIAAPKAAILKITEGDRDGISVDNIEFEFNKNVDANDQEFSITFNPIV